MTKLLRQKEATVEHYHRTYLHTFYFAAHILYFF